MGILVRKSGNVEMNLSLVFLCCLVLGMSQAMFLDNLFGPGPGYCTDDSDCQDGCCKQDPYTGRHHCRSYLSYLHQCHLNGVELHSCGCQSGYHCEDPANLESVAVEIPGGSQSQIGVCEHG